MIPRRRPLPLGLPDRGARVGRAGPRDDGLAEVVDEGVVADRLELAGDGGDGRRAHRFLLRTRCAVGSDDTARVNSSVAWPTSATGEASPRPRASRRTAPAAARASRGAWRRGGDRGWRS